MCDHGPSAPALQDLLPPASGARICFGCGADNPLGLRIKSRMEGGQCVCDFTPDPHHNAFPGVLNGGIIAGVLDCHGIWTAVADYELQQGRNPADGVTAMFVTGKLSVEYLKPAPMDRTLRVVGTVVSRGRRSVDIALEMLAEGEPVARASVLAIRVEG